MIHFFEWNLQLWVLYLYNKIVTICAVNACDSINMHKVTQETEYDGSMILGYCKHFCVEFP